MNGPAEARSSHPQPFARLGPHAVLDALEEVGLACDGRLQALNSFENRVYLVGLESGESLVAKFYRPGRWQREQLLEEHQFALEIAAAEIPLAAPLNRAQLAQLSHLARLSTAGASPPATGVTRPACNAPDSAHSSTPPEESSPLSEGSTLFESHGFFIAVYARQGGRVPGLDHVRDGPAMRERIGRFIARIHQVGARHPFRYRPALSCQLDGWAAIERILQGPWLPAEVASAWADMARRCCERIEARLQPAGENFGQIRLHGDCHLGNLLWTESHGPHFVDLDDSRMGPAIQDLWMLADAAGQQAEHDDDGSMPPGGASQAMQELLQGYRQVRDFDSRELALVEALRTLRMIRHSAWLAERWDDPAFPVAFPWFGSTRYWQSQVLHLQEQLPRI